MSLKDTLNLIKGANPLKPNMLGCWKQQQEKGEFVILGFLKTRKTNQNQKKILTNFSVFIPVWVPPHESVFGHICDSQSMCFFL